MKESRIRIAVWGGVCISFLMNFLLVGVICIIERNTHVLKKELIERGLLYVEDDDKLTADYWARFSWTNTIEKLHIDFDIAFFGNSITRGSDFQAVFPDKRIINLGYSGDNIKGMIKRVPMIKKSKAKKVFVMAGTNDLPYLSLEDYKTNFTKLITTIQDSIPGIKIYVESILPTNHELRNHTPNDVVQKANEIAEEIARQFNCSYIDLYSLYVDENDELPKEYTDDGIHLLPQYYRIWKDKITPMIYE